MLPMAADLFMEYFEHGILDREPLKASCFTRYVDDTFLSQTQAFNEYLIKHKQKNQFFFSLAVDNFQTHRCHRQGCMGWKTFKILGDLLIAYTTI